MLIRFCIKFIVCLLTTKFAFADIVNVNNKQIKELSKNNIPIIDIRRSAEWDQTGVLPKSILLTFFDNSLICSLFTSTISANANFVININKETINFIQNLINIIFIKKYY